MTLAHMALRDFVRVKKGYPAVLKALFLQHRTFCVGVRDFGINERCLEYAEPAGWRMHTGSLIFAPWRVCRVCLVTRRHGSSRLCVGERVVGGTCGTGAIGQAASQSDRQR